MYLEISRQRACSCNLCMLETQAKSVSRLPSSVQDKSISHTCNISQVWCGTITPTLKIGNWSALVLRAGAVNSLDDIFTQLSLLIHKFKFLILFLILKTICLVPRAPKSLTAGSTRILLCWQNHLGFQGKLHRIGEQY